MSATVIENGSLNIRVGYASSKLPYYNILNRGLHLPGSNPLRKFDYLFGDEADFLSPAYTPECPLRFGRIENWDLMFVIWEHLFSLISLGGMQPISGFETNDNRLQVITGLNYTKSDYFKMCQFFIEKGFTEELCFGIDAVSALMSTGQSTGLVVDIGDSGIRVFPVIDGRASRSRAWQNYIGGGYISSQIRAIAPEALSRQIAVDYVKSNFMSCDLAELRRSKEKEKSKATLPDGQSFLIGEDLITPLRELLGIESREGPGLVGGVRQVLSELDRGTAANLALRILFTGGGAQLANIDHSILTELNDKSKYKFDMINNDDKINAAFRGSYFAFESSSSLTKFFTKRDLEEFGEQIIHKNAPHLLF